MLNHRRYHYITTTVKLVLIWAKAITLDTKGAVIDESLVASGTMTVLGRGDDNANIEQIREATSVEFDDREGLTITGRQMGFGDSGLYEAINEVVIAMKPKQPGEQEISLNVSDSFWTGGEEDKD